jgi:surface antigen Omp85-like protein
MSWRSQAVIALATAAANTGALAQQEESSSWLPRPQVVLTPSAAVEPDGPMSSVRLIEDMDRQAKAKDSNTSADGNWVVAPLPFRNELLGIGLVVGAGYLYGASENESNARHSVAGAAGMYAEGGSWAALAAHRGYWSEQQYRTTVALATGDLLYDIRLEAGGAENKLRMGQQFNGGMLQGAVRVGKNGWLGIGFMRGDTGVRVRNSTPPFLADVIPSADIAVSNVLLNGEYDNRDNDLYPRSGQYAQAEGLVSREDLGADSNYQSLELEWNSYRPFGENNVLALRVAGKIVDGAAPFFALAWFGTGVDLRGYTPGRYIGESMVAMQAEWRWQATPRWGFVAFGGTGKVSGALGEIDTGSWLPAAGAGVRFRLTKALPLNMRADFAWGRDDSTFSLAVGEAF